jgi:hypothetical protein
MYEQSTLPRGSVKTFIAKHGIVGSTELRSAGVNFHDKPADGRAKLVPADAQQARPGNPHGSRPYTRYADCQDQSAPQVLGMDREQQLNFVVEPHYFA